MNNFWIPEEINLSQDVKDYPRLLPAERSAYDKILSFLVFLDSIQTANLPNIGAYITANEVNLCPVSYTHLDVYKRQDYALRILRVPLDGEKHTVAEMSETELIPNPFAYQILRKLSAGNLVRVSQMCIRDSRRPHGPAPPPRWRSSGHPDRHRRTPWGRECPSSPAYPASAERFSAATRIAATLFRRP